MTTPHFIAHDLPDSRMIDLLHDRNDGMVTFHSLANGEWADFCGIPANCIPELFPQLVSDLVHDGAFSINAFAKPTKGQETKYRDLYGDPLFAPKRKTEWVRYLNACYADLDCYKLNMSVGDIVGAVINAQDAGTIPPPSIIMRSGNGVWLFWKLMQKNGKKYGGYKDKLTAYSRVQRAIGDWFATSGSDANSRDAARVTRNPGSWNCKQPDAPKRVDYWPQINAATGTVNTYTFEELAAWLQISLDSRRRHCSKSRTQNPVYIARAAKGNAGRWKAAYERFHLLWDLRGTWRIGTRNAAAFVLSVILSEMRHLDPAMVQRELDDLFADCEQDPDKPFTRVELDKIAKAINERNKRATLGRQRIADRLEITPAESATIAELTKDRGWKAWPCAAAFREGDQLADPRPKLKKSEATERRRRIIVSLAETRRRNGFGIPDLETIADVVESNGLDRPHKTTVMRDLRSLGIANPRKWRGRKSADQTKPLPFRDDH